MLPLPSRQNNVTCIDSATMNGLFMSDSAAESQTICHGDHFERSTAVEADSLIAAVSSEALLSGRNTLVIEHLGMRYVLRATRNGKLILTK